MVRGRVSQPLLPVVLTFEYAVFSPHCHTLVPVPAEVLLNAAIILTFKLPPDYERPNASNSRSGTPLAIEVDKNNRSAALVPASQDPPPPDGALHLLRHARALKTMTLESAKKTYIKVDGESCRSVVLHCRSIFDPRILSHFS